MRCGVFDPQALPIGTKYPQRGAGIFAQPHVLVLQALSAELALLGYSLRYRLIEQLHYSHGCRIAGTMAHLQNPQIATRALLETRAQLVEELANRLLVTQPIKG